MKLVPNASVWQDMAGDTDLEKKINSYLTINFITYKDIPADECLESARYIIRLIKDHKDIKVKTLKEHNSDRMVIENSISEPIYNGLVCDICGGQLVDTYPSQLLFSNPPQKNVRCTKCSFDGYRIV